MSGAVDAEEEWGPGKDRNGRSVRDTRLCSGTILALRPYFSFPLGLWRESGSWGILGGLGNPGLSLE